MSDTAASNPEGPALAGPVATLAPRPKQTTVEKFVDHPKVDWLLTVALFGPVGALATPLLPLDATEAGVRFSFYAGVAAALLAFVTVAFTPLAILVALADTPGVRRLRRHDDVIRGQFLRATLLLMLLALALLVAGVLDAADQALGVVRFGATFVVGLAAIKVVRLTTLFWAVLAADSGRRR